MIFLFLFFFSNWVGSKTLVNLVGKFKLDQPDSVPAVQPVLDQSDSWAYSCQMVNPTATKVSRLFIFSKITLNLNVHIYPIIIIGYDFSIFQNN